MRAAGLAVLLGLMLAACGAPAGQAIDGWQIGTQVACVDRSCDALVSMAEHYLDRADPGHAPILEGTLHEWPPARDRVYSSGPPRVVVLKLGDGSVRAIGVKYIGVDTVPSIFAIGSDGEPRVICNGAACLD